MPASPDTPANSDRLIVPGRHCWQIAHADRFAIIVDADAYFRAVKDAILKARHCVFLIGWDFDTRIKLEPGKKTLEGPNKLGAFLRWMDKKRPDVSIYVLKWDLGVIKTFGRGTTPLAILDFMTGDKVRFKLDGAHPPGAAHHQKIVVIDDALAFCGGIDMTGDRWDTRDHADDDPRRRRPTGRRYGPWHDAAAIIDGPIAGALGDLARERWLHATGERIEEPPASTPSWPESIEPTFRDVDLAIARTIPPHDGRDGVHEVEEAVLALIASARRAIYCESQYFASRRIAEAIAARLREPDGPEIVIVNPLSADGWLEAKVMDSARARLIALVRRADRDHRFRIYTPVTEHGQPIYVHAKIMIVDDRFLRIGSSNLNNRSMGFDTECDLILDAAANPAAEPALRGILRDVRCDLIAEHCGTTPDAVAQALAENGHSLVRTIDSLRHDGRSLVPYEPDDPTAFEEILAENDLLDPERPSSWRRLVRRAMSFSFPSFR